MPEHEEAKLLKNINYKYRKLVIEELKKNEMYAIKESVETACVITKA